MGNRPLTPPCVPFGTRRFNHKECKDLCFRAMSKFRYTGPDIDAILDRLPTATVLDEDETGYTVQAEVFGAGINMWLRSQGDYVTRIDE